MATQKQKDEVLFETKQINALKEKRNRTRKPANKKALQDMIDAAEMNLNSKRKKWGLMYD